MKIIFSILNFYTADRTHYLLNSILAALSASTQKILDHTITIILRNNSEQEDGKKLAAVILDLQTKYTFTPIHYIAAEYNSGYGGGHNANFQLMDSDIFIVLNNDLGFPHINFLYQALEIFTNPIVGAIGAKNSPGKLHRDTANGFSDLLCDERDYLEGSILLLRSSAFKKVGLFDEQYLFCYFEDSDLSLKLRQAGYSLETIDIPHEHFRSSVTQKLPKTILDSLIEHNRSRFFSKWSEYLKNNYYGTTVVSGKVLIELLSAGIGDLVMAYYPVRSLINELAKTCCQIYLHLSTPTIAFLYQTLPCTIVYDLTAIQKYGFDRIVSLAELNYSSPFLTQDLIAAKLGVVHFDTNSDTIVKQLSILFSTKIQPLLERYKNSKSSVSQSVNYIVLHLDTQRLNFEGRAVSLEHCLPALYQLNSYSIILIGMHLPQKLFSAAFEEWVENYVDYDLRGKTTIEESAILLSCADLFIGLDSLPMNIGQLLNIPSFALFGCTHPLTKLYRQRSGAFVNKQIDCIGCYHRNIHGAFNYCMRRDEACLQKFDSMELANELKNFIENFAFAFNWQPLQESLKELQRQWLLLGMHNPIYFNQVLTNIKEENSELQQLKLKLDNLYKIKYRFGSEIDFSSIGNAPLYTRDGWSFSEHNGTWTIGNHSVLRFDLIAKPSNSEITLSFKGWGFSVPGHECTIVQILVNRIKIGSEFQIGKQSELTFTFPITILVQYFGHFYTDITP